jgi:polar amino acid transport system substrate-binding protein
LANKDVDAVIIDTPVALNLISSQPQMNLVVTKGDLTDEKYGIAVRKECSDLLNKVNAGLRAVVADGTYNTIYRKYFGQDAPPQYMAGASTVGTASPTKAALPAAVPTTAATAKS